MKDEKTRKKLIDRLSWDSRVDNTDIAVDFSQGEALLGGSVTSYSAKIAAEKASLEVPGVSSVRNDLSVKYKDIQLPGKESLKENIESLIALNLNEAGQKIDVSVHNWRVNLGGTVDAYWKKVKVEELTSFVKGVIHIKNEIAVLPERGAQDQSLAESILQWMACDDRVDPTSIHLQVKNGIVELRGAVPDRMSHDAVVEIVQHSAGVLEIHDNINVG